MSITSRILSSTVGLAFLLAATAWAELPGIQGDIKGPDRKPVSGAQVGAAPRNSKTVISTVKTDQKGHYAIRNLPVGSYNLTVNAAGMASTAATNVRTRSDGAMRIDFELKRQLAGATADVPVPTKKKAKRMVWVAAETGSNLGGRWVEVEDGSNNTAPSNLNVKRAGAGTISAVQSNPGRSAGGN
ncbi:MAG: carboxypeptidase-like regulatory domain-containing protein [Spartobacteria bacterium]